MLAYYPAGGSVDNGLLNMTYCVAVPLRGFGLTTAWHLVGSRNKMGSVTEIHTDGTACPRNTAWGGLTASRRRIQLW